MEQKMEELKKASEALLNDKGEIERDFRGEYHTMKTNGVHLSDETIERMKEEGYEVVEFNGIKSLVKASIENRTVRFISDHDKRVEEEESRRQEEAQAESQMSPNFRLAMAQRYGADLGSSLKETPDELKAIVFNRAIKASDIETDLIADGWHTFGELYEFRKVYNAVLFNTWANQNNSHTVDLDTGGSTTFRGSNNRYQVHKSWKHEDGEWCFEQEKVWFIVSAMLPTGLISNHYKAEDWDLFKVPEVEKALFKFDGHTGKDVLERLKAL